MTEDRWSSMGRPGTWQRHECPECGGPEFRTTGSGYAHKPTCYKYVRPKNQSYEEQDRQARDARNGDCSCGTTHLYPCPYAICRHGYSDWAECPGCTFVADFA